MKTTHTKYRSQETLKIYGDAEETVSTERFTVAPVTVGVDLMVQKILDI
jgi:hypothetical protein